jgi:hypothetical protein
MQNTKKKEIIDNKIQKIISLYILQNEYRHKSQKLLTKIKSLVSLYEERSKESILDECRKLEKKHKELSNIYKIKAQNLAVNSASFNY